MIELFSLPVLESSCCSPLMFPVGVVVKAAAKLGPAKSRGSGKEGAAHGREEVEPEPCCSAAVLGNPLDFSQGSLRFRFGDPGTRAFSWTPSKVTASAHGANFTLFSTISLESGTGMMEACPPIAPAAPTAELSPPPCENGVQRTAWRPALSQRCSGKPSGGAGGEGAQVEEAPPSFR